MKRVNLIPVQRRLAKQRRTYIRRCVAACAAWAFVAAGAGVATHLTWGRIDPTLEPRLQRAAQSIETADRTLAAVQADLAAARSTLRATQAIADQPDWSILLALMGRSAGPEIVLRNCNVEQTIAPVVAPVAQPTGRGAAKAPPAPPAPPVKVFSVGTQGMGRSQFAVAQFVLRLERSGLFARVSLVDTSRESFLGREAVSFRIECVLDSSPLTPASKDAIAGGGAADGATRPRGGVAAGDTREAHE